MWKRRREFPCDPNDLARAIQRKVITRFYHTRVAAKPTYFCQFTGLFGIDEDKLTVPDSSIFTTVGAFLRRFWLCNDDGVSWQPPYTPTPNFVKSVLRVFSRKFRLHGKHDYTPEEPVPFANKWFLGLKRIAYVQAAETLRKMLVAVKDSYVSAFAKREKLPKEPARLIQPRSKRYNVAVGCYIRQMEHMIYRSIAKTFRAGSTAYKCVTAPWRKQCGDHVVFKGLNAVDQATVLWRKWHLFKRPAAFGLDASRFDAHVSTSVLEWEHEEYIARVSPIYRKELRRLLDMQLKTRGFIRCPDGECTYTVAGGRCSGDMNTALGNCLIACAMVYSWIHHHHLDGKVELVNNGDDCVLIGELTNIQKLYDRIEDDKFFAALGFKMKREPVVRVFEHVEFCQTRPVYSSSLHQYVMCRGPRALMKDMMPNVAITTVAEAKEHCTAVGTAGQAMTTGIPGLHNFYTSLRSCGEGRAPRRIYLTSGFAMLSHGLTDVPESVDKVEIARSFASYLEAFGELPRSYIYTPMDSRIRYQHALGGFQF